LVLAPVLAAAIVSAAPSGILLHRWGARRVVAALALCAITLAMVGRASGGGLGAVLPWLVAWGLSAGRYQPAAAERLMTDVRSCFRIQDCSSDLGRVWTACRPALASGSSWPRRPGPCSCRCRRSRGPCRPSAPRSRGGGVGGVVRAGHGRRHQREVISTRPPPRSTMSGSTRFARWTTASTLTAISWRWVWLEADRFTGLRSCVSDHGRRRSRRCVAQQRRGSGLSGQLALTKAPAAPRRRDPTSPAPAQPPGAGGSGGGGAPRGWVRDGRSTDTVRLRPSWSPLEAARCLSFVFLPKSAGNLSPP
jgi:hypothetical protein